MNTETYQAKKEERDHLTELLAHPGYAILVKEVERLGDTGASECCDVNLPQSKRDAGAGARNMAKAIIDYPKQKLRSLEITVGKEKEARSRKRGTQ